MSSTTDEMASAEAVANVDESDKLNKEGQQRGDGAKQKANEGQNQHKAMIPSRPFCSTELSNTTDERASAEAHVYLTRSRVCQRLCSATRSSPQYDNDGGGDEMAGIFPHFL